MYTKKTYEINKGYNEDLFLVEDYDFWMRMADSQEIKMNNLGEKLTNHRVTKNFRHILQIRVIAKGGLVCLQLGVLGEVQLGL